ncbi:hypothetical protein [Pseudacidovorax intermedius]|uniref:hypothetical protein n=1 Tax=Pseudacidovorax intermedius TaxID=433924 RepID=UPI0026EF886C|nr:hypothetical protein [Pseudacidovorax intermedius]
MRKLPANTTLCALQIGLTHYVMPMTDGLKVMAAMTKAVECGEDYERNGAGAGYTYTPASDGREVSIKAIKPTQLRQPRNAPTGPLGLPHEPAKLPR